MLKEFTLEEVNRLKEVLDYESLNVEIYNPNGRPKGMHVPEMHKTIKVTHKGTGISVTCGEHRTYHENYYTCLRELAKDLKNVEEI